MQLSARPALGWTQGLVASVCSGVFVVPFKFLGETVAPVTGVFMLFICALALTAPAFALTKPQKPKLGKPLALLATCAAVTIAGNQFAILGLADLPSAVMQIIQRSEIVAMVLFGWLFFKEPLNYKVWISLILVFGGMILMNYGEAEFKAAYWLGSIFALLSGVSFALFQSLNKVLLKDYCPEEINFYRLMIALAALSLWPGILGEAAGATPWEWLWAFLAAFIGPFLGRLMFTHSLKHLEISKVGLCQAISPVFAIMAQWAAFGSVILAYEWLGSALITLAVLFIFLDQGNRKRDKT